MYYRREDFVLVNGVLGRLSQNKCEGDVRLRRQRVPICVQKGVQT